MLKVVQFIFLYLDRALCIVRKCDGACSLDTSNMADKFLNEYNIQQDPNCLHYKNAEKSDKIYMT